MNLFHIDMENTGFGSFVKVYKDSVNRVQNNQARLKLLCRGAACLIKR